MKSGRDFESFQRRERRVFKTEFAEFLIYIHRRDTESAEFLWI